MGALGCTQRTRGRRRVGSALEWQGGRRVSAHTFNRHVTFRVYLLHQEVRSMSKAFRMYLLHPDDDLSCSGSARASAQHGRSGQDVSFASGRGHGSPLGMPTFALIPRGAGSRRDMAQRR